MNLQITMDYEDMSQKASQLIIKTFQTYPNGLYCFAGGDTPVRTLQLLVEAHKKNEIDLTKAYYIELDEWIGIKQENSGSCLSYLNKNLFQPAHIPFDHIHYFNSQTEDLNQECENANAYIKQHQGLTLTLLGVGVNGHLGFNEPGVNQYNLAHVIDLDDTTKRVGQKYFDKKENLSKGITLGLQQLMESKILIVEANGYKKNQAISKVLCQEVDMLCPATIINEHPNSYLFVDEDAMRGEMQDEDIG